VKSYEQIREVSYYANVSRTQLRCIVIAKIVKRKLNKGRDVIGSSREGETEEVVKNRKRKLVLK